MSSIEPGPAVWDLIELARQVVVKAHKRTSESGASVNVRSYMRSVGTMSNAELNAAREALSGQGGNAEKNQLQRVMGEMRKRGMRGEVSTTPGQRAEIARVSAEGEQNRKKKRILSEIAAQKQGKGALSVQTPEEVRQAEFRKRIAGGTSAAQDLETKAPPNVLLKPPKPESGTEEQRARVKAVMEKLDAERRRPSGAAGRKAAAAALRRARR